MSGTGEGVVVEADGRGNAKTHLGLSTKSSREEAKKDNRY
jgi:hypothetical protein